MSYPDLNNHIESSPGLLCMHVLLLKLVHGAPMRCKSLIHVSDRFSASSSDLPLLAIIDRRANTPEALSTKVHIDPYPVSGESKTGTVSISIS